MDSIGRRAGAGARISRSSGVQWGYELVLKRKYLKLVLILPMLVLGPMFMAGAFCEVRAGDRQEITEIPITTVSAEARVLFEKGRDAIERGGEGAGAEFFKQAVELDPNFSLAWVYVARTSSSLVERSAASRKAIEVSKDVSDGERILAEINFTRIGNDASKRLDLVKHLTELYPNSPRAWLSFAGAHTELNKSKHARWALGHAIELDPNFTAAYTALGSSYLYFEPKDFTKAQKLMAKVVDFDRDNDNAWVNLGDVYRARKDLEKSFEAYDKATGLNPENSIAYVKKGHVGSFLGQYDEARVDYRRSVEVAAPQLKAYYANYGALTHVHEGKPGAAINELETILRRIDRMGLDDDQNTGSRIFTLTNMATIALHNGMFEVAESAIERLGELRRENAKRAGGEKIARSQEAVIAAWEGQLAARRGNYKRAIAKAEANAWLVGPDNNPRKMEAYHNVMGLVHLRQGNYPKAIEHYLQADHRNDMYIRYHLALALAGAGKTEKAAHIFKEVGEYNFNSVGYSLIRKDALKRAGAV